MNENEWKSMQNPLVEGLTMCGTFSCLSFFAVLLCSFS